jgi:hypothetical protein
MIKVYRGLLQSFEAIYRVFKIDHNSVLPHPFFLLLQDIDYRLRSVELSEKEENKSLQLSK